MQKHTPVPILLVVVAFGLLGCAGSGTHLEVPTPSVDEFVSMHLTCIHATPTDTLHVAGYLVEPDGTTEAILLRSEDGGDKWSRVGSETHRMDDLIIQSLHFNDTLRGWASGIRVVRGETIPVVLRTDDGGGHWRESQVPQNRETPVDSVSELAFESDDMGVLHVNFSDAATGDMLVNVYKSNDGGRHWVIDGFKEPDEVEMTDPAEQFVTEERGWRLEPALPNGTQVLSYTGSGGKVWVPRCQFHLSQFPSYY